MTTWTRDFPEKGVRLMFEDARFVGIEALEGELSTSRLRDLQLYELTTFALAEYDRDLYRQHWAAKWGATAWETVVRLVEGAEEFRWCSEAAR